MFLKLSIWFLLFLKWLQSIIVPMTHIRYSSGTSCGHIRMRVSLPGYLAYSGQKRFSPDGGEFSGSYWLNTWLQNVVTQLTFLQSTTLFVRVHFYHMFYHTISLGSLLPHAPLATLKTFQHYLIRWLTPQLSYAWTDPLVSLFVIVHNASHFSPQYFSHQHCLIRQEMVDTEV